MPVGMSILAYLQVHEIKESVGEPPGQSALYTLRR
jgi:hypothetical protein